MSAGEHVDLPSLAARMDTLRDIQRGLAQECTAVGPDRHQVGGDHYKDMKVQPWEAEEAWSTPEEFRGFLRLTAIHYLARVKTTGAMGKGGRQDVEKARHCLDKLLSVWAE